jgi:hypothetical protein
MDKNEIRGYQFFSFGRKDGNGIKWRLHVVLRDSSPSFSTVLFWVSEFKRGRTHTNDKPLPGRPKTVTTPEIVDKIHDVTLADRRIKVHEIAEAVRMSYERDFIFCTMNLIKNLSVKLMPRFLSPEQKRVPAQTPAECLWLWMRLGFTTIPKSKNQSKKWIGSKGILLIDYL